MARHIIVRPRRQRQLDPKQLAQILFALAEELSPSSGSDARLGLLGDAPATFLDRATLDGIEDASQGDPPDPEQE